MWQDIVSWAGWLVAAFAGAIAVRGTVRFDVNDWLKQRRKNQLDAIRSMCPHADISVQGSKVIVTTTYSSPFGTTACRCEECGHVTYDRDAIARNLHYWSNNIQALIDRKTKIAKRLNKFHS